MPDSHPATHFNFHKEIDMKATPEKLFNAARYARSPETDPSFAEDAEGWARYYARELIAGPRCECGVYIESGKTHAANCRSIRR